MMQIVIDIDDDIAHGIIDGQNDEPRNIVRSYQATIADAIKNGTPLPKGHGRLIDADAFERSCMFDSDIEDMQDVIYALRDYKSIIEADNKYEAKVITRGNCMMCGKKLTEGLFFCKECGGKGK